MYITHSAIINYAAMSMLLMLKKFGTIVLILIDLRLKRCLFQTRRVFLLVLDRIFQESIKEWCGTGF